MFEPTLQDSPEEYALSKGYLDAGAAYAMAACADFLVRQVENLELRLAVADKAEAMLTTLGHQYLIRSLGMRNRAIGYFRACVLKGEHRRELEGFRELLRDLEGLVAEYMAFPDSLPAESKLDRIHISRLLAEFPEPEAVPQRWSGRVVFQAPVVDQGGAHNG